MSNLRADEASASTPTTAPLFIVGTGRCGSSIIDSVLAMHPAFAWQSSWIDVFPRFPVLASVHRLWDLPGTDRFRMTRFMPTPVEPYDAWRVQLQHFSEESLDDETLNEMRTRLVPYIQRICRYHGKPTFLGKLVGRPVKVEQLAQVFPGSRFIHVTRGLKPTLASLMKVDFFAEWENLGDWRWETIPPELLEFLDECDGSPVVATAIRLLLNRREVDSQLTQVPHDRRIEIGYADFINAPVEQMRNICEFADVEASDRFLERVRAREVYGGADEKWLSQFEAREIENLDAFESRFGFGVPPLGPNPGSFAMASPLGDR